MMRALWSAASGMKSQQDNMDVVAHNLANVNTFGAKKVRAEFHDLLYQTLRPAGAESGADSQYPTGLQIGLGDRLAATQRIFSQGNLQSTGNPTDIAIEGDGFFRIEMPDGTIAYTRDGSFKLDSDRRMVTTDGYPLADNITIEQNAASDSITISPDGRVSDIVDGQQAGTTCFMSPTLQVPRWKAIRARMVPVRWCSLSSKCRISRSSRKWSI